MEYKTIEEESMAIVTEKKSKFIANIIYIENMNMAEEKIKEIKKKSWNAKHHCSAYRIIEPNGTIYEKSSDDGELAGTAGMPILNILQKSNLCNVLVVVTRYFGGILLGTGGLVRCYSEATSKAIAEAKTINICEGIEFRIEINYQELENFKYYCIKNDILISKMEYDEKIICNIEMKKENKKNFLEDIAKRNINVLENKEVCDKFIKKK